MVVSICFPLKISGMTSEDSSVNVVTNELV